MKKEQLRAAAESRRRANPYATISVAQNNSLSRGTTLTVPPTASMQTFYTSQPELPRRDPFRPFATFPSSSRFGLGKSNYLGEYAYSYFRDENVKVHPVRTTEPDKTEPEAESKPKRKARSKGKSKKKPEMVPIYLKHAYFWYHLVRHMVFDEGMDTYRLTVYCCPKALVWMIVKGWIELDDVVKWRPARHALGEGLVDFAELSRSTELLNGTYPTNPPQNKLEKPTQEEVEKFQHSWPEGNKFNTHLKYNWRNDREDRSTNGPFGEKVRRYATPCVQEKILHTFLESDGYDIRDDWKQIFGLLFDAKKGNFAPVINTSSWGNPTAAPAPHEHAQASHEASAAPESGNETSRKRKYQVTVEDADDEDEQGPKNRFASEGNVIERATPEPEGRDTAPTIPEEGKYDQVRDVPRPEIDIQVPAIEQKQESADNTSHTPSPFVNNDIAPDNLFPDAAGAPTTADASMEDIDVPSVLQHPHAPAPTAIETDEVSMDVDMEMALDTSTTGPPCLQNDVQGGTSVAAGFAFGQASFQAGTGKRLKQDAMETVSSSTTAPTPTAPTLPNVFAPAQAQYQTRAQPVLQTQVQPMPQAQTQTQAFTQPTQMQAPQSVQPIQPCAQPVAQPVAQQTFFNCNSGRPLFTIGAAPATSRNPNTRVRRAIAFRTKWDIERQEKERARRPRRRADASLKVSK